MTDTDNAFPHAAQTPDPHVTRIFHLAKKCIVIFGVAGAILLATLVVVVIAHGTPSVFMWVRATILLAMAPLLRLFAERARRGGRSEFQRLRLLSTVLPIAIVVVDLIPGVCPIWYAVMQSVSALALAPIALLMRRQEIHRAFSDEP